MPNGGGVAEQLRTKLAKLGSPLRYPVHTNRGDAGYRLPAGQAGRGRQAWAEKQWV